MGERATRLLAVRKNWLGVVCALAALSVVERSALALDKQGSAHGGQVGGDEKEFNVSGSGTASVSLVQPWSYAARPNNTGLALFRYALHVDVDLLGRMLFIPIDVNMFTDRLRHGAALFAPSELDLIGGLTSTNSLTECFDLGARRHRAEHDRRADHGNYTQTYVDARARLLYSAAAISAVVRSRIGRRRSVQLRDARLVCRQPVVRSAARTTRGKRSFATVAHSELAVWAPSIGARRGRDFLHRQARVEIRFARASSTSLPRLIGRYDRFEACTWRTNATCRSIRAVSCSTFCT